MKNTLVSIVVIIAIMSCDNNMTNKKLIKEAELCMQGAMTEASNWLKILDEKGYKTLTNQEYPPPFDAIMRDSMNIYKIQSKIESMEQEFGQVDKRDFFGVHVIIDGKIITYVPSKMKRFKQISPKRLGLNKISDLYKNTIKGTYVLLMYNSKPIKKEYAEELIVTWLNKEKQWSIIDYYIDDEI